MALEFIVLGCGSSMGVPRPDGFFGKCNPKNKKNYRTRCSALIKSSNENVLIDTSPDLRDQLLKNNIKKIDRVLYSHLHGDQTHGINDLRVFYLKKRKVIPIYADTKTSNYLKKTFGHRILFGSIDFLRVSSNLYLSRYSLNSVQISFFLCPIPCSALGEPLTSFNRL